MKNCTLFPICKLFARRMKFHNVLPPLALAFALSACEQPTVVAVDVEPAFAISPAACQGQMIAVIVNTWPFAHDGQVDFPPPPGSIALWLQEIGEPFFGISTVRELQALFCGASHMATGSGHRVETRGDDPELFRNFSFAAHSDGGQFQIVNRTFDIRLHGSLECLTVVGNEAWFAGHVTQSSDPNRIPVGSIRAFYVVDNGEGNGDPPDQIAHSTRLRTISAQQWCDIAPVRDLFDIEQGNIQVQ